MERLAGFRVSPLSRDVQAAREHKNMRHCRRAPRGTSEPGRNRCNERQQPVTCLAPPSNKKGQLTLPFFADIGDWLRYLRCFRRLPSYFFDENAANFLLNFST